MGRLIRAFTLGSCDLHTSQAALTAGRFFDRPFHALGFYETPFALSSGSAVQLANSAWETGCSLDRSNPRLHG